MNLKKEIVTFPKRYKPVPKPFYVVRCDEHFMVCELDDDFNLITEVSSIHWDVYQVRRWAIDFGKIRDMVNAKRLLRGTDK